MASPNAFLNYLENEIALAIQEETAARGKKEPSQTSNTTDSGSATYSIEQLAELIYYSASAAAQTFQQELSRTQARLNLTDLGTPNLAQANQSNGTDNNPASQTVPRIPSPADPANVLAQLNTVLQFHSWSPANNQALQNAVAQGINNPQTRISNEILTKQLTKAETLSLELQTQRTLNTLAELRKGNLRHNFVQFYEQISAPAKNHLLTQLAADIVLHPNDPHGQINFLTSITRSSVKDLTLSPDRISAPGITPLPPETFNGLLEERAAAAKQLRTQIKIPLGINLRTHTTAILVSLNQLFQPGGTPSPKEIAAQAIQKLTTLLGDFGFPAQALQEALDHNVSASTDKNQDAHRWTKDHQQLKEQYSILPAEQRAAIEKVTGTVQPALACALAAAQQKFPKQKPVLSHIASLLTTGQLPTQTVLERISVLLTVTQQLQSEQQILELKIPASVHRAALAAFNQPQQSNADAPPQPIDHQLRRYKTEGEELIGNLQSIVRSQNDLPFANNNSPLTARLERAYGLTQLHPVLRLGLSDSEIAQAAINLLKERHNPTPSLKDLPRDLEVERLLQNANQQHAQNGSNQNPDSLHQLQKTALAAHQEENLPLFHNQLKDTIAATIAQGVPQTADTQSIKATLARAAQFLQYQPLQPPTDSKTLEKSSNAIVKEILRHAKTLPTGEREDLEQKFSNPSETDMRVVVFQAHKQVEQTLADKIARTVRKNTALLQEHINDLQHAFQSPDQLARTWILKENAESTLQKIHETKSQQLTEKIKSLQTALEITNQAKEIQTIEQFKQWVIDTHTHALNTAQAQSNQDPFNLSPRKRIQELNHFESQLKTARTSVTDPSGNLDIRAVWEILERKKLDLQRELETLRTQHIQILRVKTTIQDPETVQALSRSNQTNGSAPHAPTTGSQGAPRNENSLAQAFEAAFSKKLQRTAPEQQTANGQDQTWTAWANWTNPFQGNTLEVIIDAGSRHRQLQSKTQQLQEYWNNLILLPKPNSEALDDQAKKIRATAELLILQQIAQHPTKPELPAQMDQLWSRHTLTKQDPPRLTRATHKSEKTLTQSI